MTLHQINQLTYAADLEATWQNSLQTGDQILFLEEGILRTTQYKNELKTLIEVKKITIFYLQSDAKAYGFTPNIGKSLSDEEWVELTFSAPKNISW